LQVFDLKDGSTLLRESAEAIGLAPAGAGRALLLWRQGGTVQAGFITGTVLSSRPIPLAGVIGEVRVASGPQGFLVANGYTGLLLDADGMPSGSPIAIPAEGGQPRVVWDGAGYLAVWSTLSNVMRAARVTSAGAVWAHFLIGQGTVGSVSSAGDRTIVVYGTSCGAVASRTIGRGELRAGDESLLSIQSLEQASPQLASTPFGQEVTWMEAGMLLARFVTTAGSFGEVVTLGPAGTASAKVLSVQGGSVVVWAVPAVGLQIVRFDPFGHFRRTDLVTASHFVFTISVAPVADELFIVTDGEELSGPYEVYGTRVGGDGELRERVLLSGPGEDGFNAVAGGDEQHWLAAWRNGASRVVTVTMDHGNLRSQQRAALTLPTSAVAFLDGLRGGSDPAVIWDDRTDLVRLHATFFDPQTDVVLAEGADGISAVRLENHELFWNSFGAGSRILSAPIGRSPVAPQEQKCLTTSQPIAFAARDGALSALAYEASGRLFVQFPVAPARPHAARH
jgi:hypothetical protein